MNKEAIIKEAFALKRKLVVLEYAKTIGNAAEAYRFFEVPKSTFYTWKKAFALEGRAGLVRKKPIARSHPKQIPPDIVEKILHLRRTYHLGPQRIAWYLERYHGAKISCSTVYRTLVRNGLPKLPRKVGRRAIHARRYAKRVPVHHIQVDVKFLNLRTADDNKVRRYQYTAIDDATRIRALKTYKRHNQKNAIDFIDYVIEKFPFLIHTIWTDRGPVSRARLAGRLLTKPEETARMKHVATVQRGRAHCTRPMKELQWPGGKWQHKWVPPYTWPRRSEPYRRALGSYASGSRWLLTSDCHMT